MAVTHTTTARNGIADYIRGQIGATTARLAFRVGGSADSPGTAAATITGISFGAASGGTISMTGGPYSDTNATGNASAVNKASLQSSTNVVVVYCDVAASGSDINLSGGLVINAGDTVTITSLSYSAPA